MAPLHRRPYRPSSCGSKTQSRAWKKVTTLFNSYFRQIFRAQLTKKLHVSCVAKCLESFWNSHSPDLCLSHMHVQTHSIPSPLSVCSHNHSKYLLGRILASSLPQPPTTPNATCFTLLSSLYSRLAGCSNSWLDSEPSGIICNLYFTQAFPSLPSVGTCNNPNGMKCLSEDRHFVTYFFSITQAKIQMLQPRQSWSVLFTFSFLFSIFMWLPCFFPLLPMYSTK